MTSQYSYREKCSPSQNPAMLAPWKSRKRGAIRAEFHVRPGSTAARPCAALSDQFAALPAIDIFPRRVDRARPSPSRSETHVRSGTAPRRYGGANASERAQLRIERSATILSPGLIASALKMIISSFDFVIVRERLGEYPVTGVANLLRWDRPKSVRIPSRIEITLSLDHWT